MKYLIPLLMSCLILASCKKEDNDNPQPVNNGNVTSTLIKGSFYVSYFKEDGNDETSDFQGYTFTFDANGGAVASGPGGTVNGSWSVGNDDSKSKLNLSFGSTDPLEELNEDWEVLTITDSKVDLRHVSGGDGSVDLLTFTRQ